MIHLADLFGCVYSALIAKVVHAFVCTCAVYYMNPWNGATLSLG